MSLEYILARYIQKITVSYGDENVFTMDGDASVSANPVISFNYGPEGTGSMKSKPRTTRTAIGTGASLPARRATETGHVPPQLLTAVAAVFRAAAAPANSPVGVRGADGYWQAAPHGDAALPLSGWIEAFAGKAL